MRFTSVPYGLTTAKLYESEFSAFVAKLIVTVV